MSDSAAAAQLASHPINETIRRLIELSESADQTESREVLDEGRKAALDRVFSFSRRLHDLIATASDADVSFGGLAVINNALANAINEVSSFFANKNPGHVDNAVTHLDSATTTATWTFFQVSPKGSRAYGETIASVQKAASDAIENLKQEQATSVGELAKTREQIEIQNQNIASATEQIALNKQANDSALAEMRTAFQTIENEFRRRIDETEKERIGAFDTLAKKLDQSAAGTLKKLAEHETAAKRIVQIVGNVGVTGNYQNRSTEEQRQANLWRWITVALFGTGVVLVAVNLILNFKGEVDFTTLIARFAIAVAIALPAFYTARESARHRTNADRAKQTELELASLLPFIETLDAEKRKEIIGTLATAYFGSQTAPHTAGAPVALDEVQKTVSAMTELVAKVKGA